jgi:UDP-glucose:O-linked fucose beta-1,3-glucosyltransferase
MEERKSEISVHKDVLKAQYKTINDEKHKLITDLRDRESKVEKLKARFEIVPRGDDEGHSQAYFVIKAAQKREELQRKGDELDQDVRKCERDIRALQATLDHLNVLTLSYLLTYLLAYSPTHSLTYLLTYSLTH